MTYTVYIHPKCSTCQNALNFLKQKKISFVTKDITQTPPSKKELQEMLHYLEGDVRKLFNTSGLLYKELHMKEKLPQMSTVEALELLSSQGMLVKRPFLLGEDKGIVGFREEKWSDL